jgi:hypothetical protein
MPVRLHNAPFKIFTDQAHHQGMQAARCPVAGAAVVWHSLVQRPYSVKLHIWNAPIPLEKPSTEDGTFDGPMLFVTCVPVEAFLIWPTASNTDVVTRRMRALMGTKNAGMVDGHYRQSN